jgi:hypothetical protein
MKTNLLSLLKSGLMKVVPQTVRSLKGASFEGALAVAERGSPPAQDVQESSKDSPPALKSAVSFMARYSSAHIETHDKLKNEVKESESTLTPVAPKTKEAKSTSVIFVDAVPQATGATLPLGPTQMVKPTNVSVDSLSKPSEAPPTAPTTRSSVADLKAKAEQPKVERSADRPHVQSHAAPHTPEVAQSPTRNIEKSAIRIKSTSASVSPEIRTAEKVTLTSKPELSIQRAASSPPAKIVTHVQEIAAKQTPAQANASAPSRGPQSEPKPIQKGSSSQVLPLQSQVVKPNVAAETRESVQRAGKEAITSKRVLNPTAPEGLESVRAEAPRNINVQAARPEEAARVWETPKENLPQRVLDRATTDVKQVQTEVRQAVVPVKCDSTVITLRPVELPRPIKVSGHVPSSKSWAAPTEPVHESVVSQAQVLPQTQKSVHAAAPVVRQAVAERSVAPKQQTGSVQTNSVLGDKPSTPQRTDQIVPRELKSSNAESPKAVEPRRAAPSLKDRSVVNEFVHGAPDQRELKSGNAESPKAVEPRRAAPNLKERSVVNEFVHGAPDQSELKSGNAETRIAVDSRSAAPSLKERSVVNEFVRSAPARKNTSSQSDPDSATMSSATVKSGSPTRTIDVSPIEESRNSTPTPSTSTGAAQRDEPKVLSALTSRAQSEGVATPQMKRFVAEEAVQPVSEKRAETVKVNAPVEQNTKAEYSTRQNSHEAGNVHPTKIAAEPTKLPTRETSTESVKSDTKHTVAKEANTDSISTTQSSLAKAGIPETAPRVAPNNPVPVEMKQHEVSLVKESPIVQHTASEQSARPVAEGSYEPITKREHVVVASQTGKVTPQAEAFMRVQPQVLPFTPVIETRASSVVTNSFDGSRKEQVRVERASNEQSERISERSENSITGKGSESKPIESANTTRQETHSQSGEREAGTSAARAGMENGAATQTAAVAAPKSSAFANSAANESLKLALQHALEQSRRRLVEPDELRLTVPFGEMGTLDIDVLRENEMFSIRIAADPALAGMMEEQRQQLAVWLKDQGFPIQQLEIAERQGGYSRREGLASEHTSSEREQSQSGGSEKGPGGGFGQGDNPEPNLPRPAYSGARVWTA